MAGLEAAGGLADSDSSRGNVQFCILKIKINLWLR